MMRKQKMESVTFYFVAAVFLACYLAETAECYRRRKPPRIDVRKEADSTKPVGVREGEILFGKSLKGPESQRKDGTNQPPSNSSMEDETGYQADFPVFPHDPAHMAAWNQMTKSLQCGANQMDFRVVGSGHQHFAVDPLNGPPLPFPVIPPRCGYNMRRFPYFLRLSIPYSGCNVLNQGGHYMLPLTWRGIPIVLSCQLPPPPPPDFPNGHPWPQPHPMPPYPPVYIPPPYPWHPLPGQTTTSPPTTAPHPVGWPMEPWHVHPHEDDKHWDYWNVPPAPTTAAPPDMPQMPLPYPFPWYHEHPHPPPHPYYNYPYYHKHPHHHHHPYWLQPQVPTPDSPPTTTMMPYVPVPYPPYPHGQRKGFPDPPKS